MCITQSELEGRLFKLHIYWDADKAPVQKTTVYAVSRRGAMRKAERWIETRGRVANIELPPRRIEVLDIGLTPKDWNSEHHPAGGMVSPHAVAPSTELHEVY